MSLFSVLFWYKPSLSQRWNIYCLLGYKKMYEYWRVLYVTPAYPGAGTG